MDASKVTIGKRVKFVRRNGEEIKGTVASKVREESNGQWVDVNVGDKKAPVIIKARPSKLSAA